MSDVINIHYEFHSFQFIATEDGGLVRTSGTLSANGKKGLFGLALAPIADGHWQLKDWKATGDTAILLSDGKVLQALVNKVGKLLNAVNIWPGESTCEGGARLMLNEKLAPTEVGEDVVISFRPNMLSLVASNWKDLWILIEGRLEGDRFFRVHGFSEADTRVAFCHLRQIFPGDWVRAKYKRARGGGGVPLLSANIPQKADSWFPAVVLARTALGAICIDPGWNYLVEIGLSIQELQGYDGLDKLKGQIARSSGSQHHLCLAAELHRRGYLVSLDPTTGSGGATNDIRAKVGDNEYDIEVKEFSSEEPGDRLAREVEDKCGKMPKRPTRPVVFHAVLVERDGFDPAKEKRFFNEVVALRGIIPDKISAIVAGRRFVDSAGGRAKRDAEHIVLNPKALAPSNRADLETLFCRNYESIKYPMYGTHNSVFSNSTGEK